MIRVRISPGNFEKLMLIILPSIVFDMAVEAGIILESGALPDDPQLIRYVKSE